MENQDFPKSDFEVVVINDGSSDKTEKVVSDFKEKLDLKYIKENHRGASFARNVGVKNAKGEVMVFFDDDATARGDWLKNIAVIMASEHIITGRVKPAHQNIWRHFAPHYDQGDAPVESEIILEGNCAIRREVFNNVGLFDENLDYGHEGKEFLARAREKYNIKYYPQAVIYHDYAFGFFNYLQKQWRFGEKMTYLKRNEIKNIYDLIVNYKKLKSDGHKSTKTPQYHSKAGYGAGQKHKNIFLVKLIAKCGSGAHFFGAIAGYFKYKNYGRKS